MDGHRFDAWTRSLVVPRSRRRLLGSLAAGALGLVGLGRAEAVACRAPGDLCRENADCCSTYCAPKDATGRHRCACLAPSVACRRQCVDPTTAFLSDPANCGSCGTVCGSPDTCTLPACADGACNATSVCAGESVSCCGTGEAGCTNLDSDPNNCGACGNACGSGQTCSGGTCCDCIGSQGACVSVGGLDPANLCKQCSLTGWMDKICGDGDPTDCVEVSSTCDPATGCQQTTLPNGTACGVEEPCTAGGICPCTSGGVCQDGECVATPANEGKQCGEVDPFGCSQTPICQSGSCVQVPENEGELCGIQPNDDCRQRVCRDGSCVEENATEFGFACEGPIACLSYHCAREPNDPLTFFCVEANLDLCTVSPPADCIGGVCNRVTGGCDYTGPASGTIECDENRPCCPSQVCSPMNPCNPFGSTHYCYDPQDVPNCPNLCCGFVCC